MNSGPSDPRIAALHHTRWPHIKLGGKDLKKKEEEGWKGEGDSGRERKLKSIQHSGGGDPEMQCK